MEGTGTVKHSSNFIMIIDNMSVASVDLLYLVYRPHVPQTQTEWETVHQLTVVHVARDTPLVMVPCFVSSCNEKDKK